MSCINRHVTYLFAYFLAYLAGFSIDLNFQDVVTFKPKKFGRQRTKSGSHVVGLQENSSKDLT